MIKIENVQIVGWEPALRGMRNPKNSWAKSDSKFICPDEGTTRCCGEPHIGPNDHKLIEQLIKGGAVHAKFRRMIVVYVDVTAPLYWWKEYDTYKVGTVANSCSTMHKIMEKEFTEEDFSHEHLLLGPLDNLTETVALLNYWRCEYNKADNETRRKECWWQIIQTLSTSYNQRRTLMLNYEVLHNIYFSRKNHKLQEWRDFCAWIGTLPYSEIITTPETKPDISFEDVITWIKKHDNLTNEQYKELRLAVMNQRCCGALGDQLDLGGYHVNPDGSFDCDGPIKER